MTESHANALSASPNSSHHSTPAQAASPRTEATVQATSHPTIDQQMNEVDFLVAIVEHVKNINKVESSTELNSVMQEIEHMYRNSPWKVYVANIHRWITAFDATFARRLKKKLRDFLKEHPELEDDPSSHTSHQTCLEGHECPTFGVPISDFWSSVNATRCFSDVIEIHEKMKQEYGNTPKITRARRKCFNFLSDFIDDVENYREIVSEPKRRDEEERLKGMQVTLTQTIFDQIIRDCIKMHGDMGLRIGASVSARVLLSFPNPGSAPHVPILMQIASDAIVEQISRRQETEATGVPC